MNEKIKELNLADQINSYLADRSLNVKSKSDFLKRIMDNWQISSPSLSRIYDFSDAFVAKHLRNPDNGIKHRDLIKFSKEYNKQKDPNNQKEDYLFLDYEGLLNLYRIFNANLNDKIYEFEGEKIYNLDAIIKKQQVNLEQPKSFNEKRVAGIEFLKEIKEFYGFNTNSLAIFCKIEESLLYNYLDETTKFNSIENLYTPEICRGLTNNLFRHDEEKANLVANLLVGIKKIYTNEDLYESIKNKEVTLSDAIFIFRYIVMRQIVFRKCKRYTSRGSC